MIHTFYGDAPTQTYTCSHCGRRWEYLGHDGDCNCYGSLVASSERPHLAESGYVREDNGTWKKVVSKTSHTARRDHKCGTVKAGDKYTRKTWRIVDDETGKWIHYHHKAIIKGGA